MATVLLEYLIVLLNYIFKCAQIANCTLTLKPTYANILVFFILFFKIYLFIIIIFFIKLELRTNG